MRMLLAAAALALVVAEGAAGELVARGVQDGMLTTTRGGHPVVAYVRGTSLRIATRTAPSRWRATRAATVARGSTVVALASGAVSVVMPLTATTPIFVLLLSWFFLKGVELLTGRVVAGTVLIVLGVCLITVLAGR